jgi:hypothetical protein
VSSTTTVIGSSGPSSRVITSRATANPSWSMSHTAWEKNRQAAWKDTRPAIRAPASMPTTLRRPVRATRPVARMVNMVNVPRRRNTGRKGSSRAAHDPGKITHGR